MEIVAAKHPYCTSWCVKAALVSAHVPGLCCHIKLLLEDMGCKLQKPRGSDETPGKIFSTLRRAQVETHSGVAYTYYFLDFLLGKEEVSVSSVLCVSSVRELALQLCEFYQKGFVLAAVHPFLHYCGPANANLQKQLHRAVLIRRTQSQECGLSNWTKPHLRTDTCYEGLQAPDSDAIQAYVKKVQDLADLGDLFVGFLPQPAGSPHISNHWEPEELWSLHSSPCSILLSGRNPDSSSLRDRNTDKHTKLHTSQDFEQKEDFLSLSFQARSMESREGWSCTEKLQSWDCQCTSVESVGAEDVKNSLLSDELILNSSKQVHSVLPCVDLLENHRREKQEQVMNQEKPSPTRMKRFQMFALYNHTAVISESPKFFSLRIPLQVHREAGLVSSLEAHWLDHMTQHFRNGARLIDGYFHLRDDEAPSSTVEGVFIFQRASGDIGSNSVYDAIVVEQWTVIDGVAVKTDYIPLLQSLAPYGWRLMCVLPTPIVKIKSDGSLATKQILFLQRATLTRKRRDLTVCVLDKQFG
ncbi:hypothetical protein DNTS_005594 [Danionella cerebrum]|uniref:Raftlin family member 2 n=1 Tax=Danionella cerebrum TaxID=2873325 RepID=A0A553NJZ7_9TELE|nr:hypothetical protein DNTS_005594 [Danionella translucida]